MISSTNVYRLFVGAKDQRVRAVLASTSGERSQHFERIVLIVAVRISNSIQAGWLCLVGMDRDIETVKSVEDALCSTGCNVDLFDFLFLAIGESDAVQRTVLVASDQTSSGIGRDTYPRALLLWHVVNFRDFKTIERFYLSSSGAVCKNSKWETDPNYRNAKQKQSIHNISRFGSHFRASF